jgi:hypothetical protein
MRKKGGSSFMSDLVQNVIGSNSPAVPEAASPALVGAPVANGGARKRNGRKTSKKSQKAGTTGIELSPYVTSLVALGLRLAMKNKGSRSAKSSPRSPRSSSRSSRSMRLGGNTNLNDPILGSTSTQYEFANVPNDYAPSTTTSVSDEYLARYAPSTTTSVSDEYLAGGPRSRKRRVYKKRRGGNDALPEFGLDSTPAEGGGPKSRKRRVYKQHRGGDDVLDSTPADGGGPKSRKHRVYKKRRGGEQQSEPDMPIAEPYGAPFQATQENEPVGPVDPTLNTPVDPTNFEESGGPTEETNGGRKSRRRSSTKPRKTKKRGGNEDPVFNMDSSPASLGGRNTKKSSKPRRKSRGGNNEEAASLMLN